MMKLARYAMAAIGPVGTAGAQFLLSLALLRTLTPDEFGAFAFLLLASTLSVSVWSALFCAPLLVFLANDGRDPGAAKNARAVLAMSLFASVGAVFVAGGVALIAHETPTQAMLYGGFAAMNLVRWLGRAHAYAIARPLRTMASDLVYTLTLLPGIALLFMLGWISVASAFGLLLFAGCMGTLVFGDGYLRPLLAGLGLRSLRDYGSVWNLHARWSLIGVISTEATVNCHAYIVTAVHGPAAFAPIAATQLMVRPITVAQNALLEYERAQMARTIGSGELSSLRRAMGNFRIALILLWVVVAAAAAGMLVFAPRLIFPESYSLDTLAIGSASWLVVMLVRTIRGPESALLQAAGAFRPLAAASVNSALFSIITVIAIVVVAAPLWSILGVLTGELAFLYWLCKKAHQWLAQRHPSDLQHSEQGGAAEQ